MTSKNHFDAWNNILDSQGGGWDGTDFGTGSALDGLDIQLMTPKEIVAGLNKTVIGQEEAKQLVSIAARNRLLAMSNRAVGRVGDDFFFEKNNILLVGNTGCGKTHLVKGLAETLTLPVTIQDATTFTSSGYVGRDIEQCVEQLLENSNRCVEKLYDTSSMSIRSRMELVKEVAEFGIIYIDEADKIRASASSSGKDVNGRAVQEGFLKLVEGTEVKVRTTSYIGNIDTSNMLFIFGGAFSDLNKIIEARLNVNQIGFNRTKEAEKAGKNPLRSVSIKDFTSYGMIPELMGRLSTVALLEPLDEGMIRRILVEPHRSILSQVVNEFKSYGVHLSFSDCAIDLIIKDTMKLNLGARGLKASLQKIMRPLNYYLPSEAPIEKEVVVTKQMLDEIKEQGL